MDLIFSSSILGLYVDSTVTGNPWQTDLGLEKACGLTSFYRQELIWHGPPKTYSLLRASVRAKSMSNWISSLFSSDLMFYFLFLSGVTAEITSAASPLSVPGSMTARL